ncbi:MAG: threonine aldolase family protein [Luteibaculaceae bacterium]
MFKVDLLSDTVTRPTKAMYEAMISAPVGDDVFGEDPTVNALEQMVADLFGMERGLFTPTGTMANQIAIKAQTHAGERIICSNLAHIHIYESGGLAFHSGLTTCLVDGDRGRISAEAIASALLPNDIHYPPTTLVALEDTVNRGGGCFYRWDELERISDLCKSQHLKLHLDGARLFNALMASGYDFKLYASLFDSISICLSKGLGAPVGSVLIGGEKFIQEARRKRKLFGGGMRQAGVLAAAGIYALENNIDHLKVDAARAKAIEKALLEKPNCIKAVLPVETNIVIFEPVEGFEEHIATRFKEAGIRGIGMGSRYRLVTHLNLSDNDINYVLEVIGKL